MIKTLVVVVVQQCIFLHCAKGNDLTEHHENTSGNQDVNSEGRNRNGRILASYSKTTKDKTAEAVVKLDSLVSATGNVSAEIGKLSSSVNSSQSEKLAKLQKIETSLSMEGDLAKAMKKVEATTAHLLDALTNSSRNGTILYDHSMTYNILKTKLSSIEKIFGYDEYTTTTVPSTTTIPSTTTTSPTTTISTTTSANSGAKCSKDADCADNPIGPFCSDANKCVECRSDGDCRSFWSSPKCTKGVCTIDLVFP